MSYVPVYTTEVLVEGITQVTITASSTPTTAQTASWIEEVETGVVDRRLGSHSATGVYVDVPEQGEVGGEYSAAFRAQTGRLRIQSGMGAGSFVPLLNVKSPVVSISKLYKNDEDLEDAPVWDALTEGPASGSSFILLQSDNLGYALFFYDNLPLPGYKRLKLDYSFGYNVGSKVLQEYCTLGVAVKVLEARRGTSSADGLSEFSGGSLGTYVPTQYESRIAGFRIRMAEIEVKHFPRRKLPMAIIK